MRQICDSRWIGEALSDQLDPSLMEMAVAEAMKGVQKQKLL